MAVPRSLEVVLEGKLDYPSAMFIRDFSEVIQRRLGESEPASWIAEVGPCSTRRAIRRRRYSSYAFGLEDEVDIAISSITNIDPRRVCLVEDIEEPASELNLLGL